MLPSLLRAEGGAFSDNERAAPPAIGATITVRYQELSDGGVPRFPSYLGIRADAPLATAQAAKIATPSKKPVKLATGFPGPAATLSMNDKPRYFEFTEGKSGKFWEVSQSGSEATTRWGRIGSTGQSKTKSLADEATAARQVSKSIEEKTAEGYVEK